MCCRSNARNDVMSSSDAKARSGTDSDAEPSSSVSSTKPCLVSVQLGSSAQSSSSRTAPTAIRNDWSSALPTTVLLIISFDENRHHTATGSIKPITSADTIPKTATGAMSSKKNSSTSENPPSTTANHGAHRNIGTIVRRLARQSAGDGAHLKSTQLLMSPRIVPHDVPMNLGDSENRTVARRTVLQGAAALAALVAGPGTAQAAPLDDPEQRLLQIVPGGDGTLWWHKWVLTNGATGEG